MNCANVCVRVTQIEPLWCARPQRGTDKHPVCAHLALLLLIYCVYVWLRATSYDGFVCILMLTAADRSKCPSTASCRGILNCLLLKQNNIGPKKDARLSSIHSFIFPSSDTNKWHQNKGMSWTVVQPIPANKSRLDKVLQRLSDQEKNVWMSLFIEIQRLPCLLSRFMWFTSFLYYWPRDVSMETHP